MGWRLEASEYGGDCPQRLGGMRRKLRNFWGQTHVSKGGFAKERERGQEGVKEETRSYPTQKRALREIRRVHSGMSHRGLNSSKPAGRGGGSSGRKGGRGVPTYGILGRGKTELHGLSLY